MDPSEFLTKEDVRFLRELDIAAAVMDIAQKCGEHPLDVLADLRGRLLP